MKNQINRTANKALLLVGTTATALSFGVANPNAAQAATLTYTASFPGSGTTTATNFVTKPVSPDIRRFDPSLGTLTSVKVTLNGLVGGDAKVESKNATAAKVTVQQSATVSFYVTGITGPVIQVIPLTTQIFNAGAYDKKTDFAGTSGITYQNLTAGATNSITLTTGLNPFIGTGFLAGSLSGQGSSKATGSGNLVTSFSTKAGGTVTVEYNYNVPIRPVPEPTTSLGAMIAIGFGSFFKKNWLKML